MGGRSAKQYLRLNGLPILVHTLLRFQESAAIQVIVLVVPEEDVEQVRWETVAPYGLSKVSRIVPGGPRRQDSVWNGLKILGNDVNVVLVHDGVRPFVSPGTIQQTAMEAQSCGAVIAAVPVKDTIKVCDQNHRIVETPDRVNLWQAQTPQAFRRDLLIRAYETAQRDGYSGTDDASLVERLGHPVRVIPGTYDNIKITTPEDLLVAEAWMRERACFR
jgi:2-C-methyl-D-erythritol 4-phosphate cytidylyltransferase